jgi:aryl-alcohol dehydrogenase-like predicted oxidoreductase
MDYGINGKKKPSLKESIQLLDFATQNDILSIDTATAYGNAEEIVGTFIRKRTISREQLWIGTKLLPNVLDECDKSQYHTVIREKLTSSLQMLGTDYVDAYYFHSSRYAFDMEMLSALYPIQEEGLAKKIGVSVYEPSEAFACLESGLVSIIQAPYSVFDHRMKDSNVLRCVKEKHCEIHTRSTFLQGLILMKEEQVPECLVEARQLIRKIDFICKREGVDRVSLALAYVRREKAISKLVIGVHSLEQLKDNINRFHDIDAVEEVVLNEIEKEIGEVNAQIVIPSVWKK